MTEKSTDPVFQSDGLRILTRILEQPGTLSEAALGAIARFTGRFLVGRQHTVVLRQALRVASAIGYPALLPQVQRIAAAPTPADAELQLVGIGLFSEITNQAALGAEAIRGGVAR